MKRTALARAQNGDANEVTTLVRLLRAYTKNRDLSTGIRLHDDILRHGLQEECSDALVTMYAKCGELAKASELFNMHKSKDTITWTALISSYSQKGGNQEALNYFNQMRRESIAPNPVTFTCVLKACACIGALGKGEEIHDEIAQQGLLENNTVLATALLDMYAKCGAFTKARQVLEQLLVRNVTSWNALIAGYVQHGYFEDALDCIEAMEHEGVLPDAVTFTCILKACGSIRAADKGASIHDKIVEQGLLQKDIVLGTALVDMYAKCGALDMARGLLQELSLQDVVSWNALITGYAQQGNGEQALNCFKEMRSKGIFPDVVTFMSLLKACGSMRAQDEGERVHDETVKQGLLLAHDVMLSTALVDMYAKCGAFTKAEKVLKDLPVRNVASWNALIGGYAEHGEGAQAMKCFEQMEREGHRPTSVTFTCVLKACGIIQAADKGEKIHEDMAKQGLLEGNVVLGTALIDMYMKCGAFTKAQQVLEKLFIWNVICWNALIAGYAEQGEVEQALNCFEEMLRAEISADSATLTCILKACGSIGATHKGERLHDEIAKQGLLEDDVGLGTALVDMYAKCGALAKAQKVLEELPVQNVTLWNALITGYARQSEDVPILGCFDLMICNGISPNAATFSCVLSACSHLGLVEEAEKYLQSMVLEYGIKPGMDHYTCMVDTFGSVGHLDKAIEMIKTMKSSDSIVWSALLAACERWGDVTVGRWAFDHAVQVDKADAGNYLLMANIYAAAGMQEDAESIEAMAMQNKACIKRGQPAHMDITWNGPSFLVGDTKHTQIIYGCKANQTLIGNFSIEKPGKHFGEMGVELREPQVAMVQQGLNKPEYFFHSNSQSLNVYNAP